MENIAPVSFNELLESFEWLSFGDPFENQAYVNRISGRIFCSSSSGDVEEELPDDIEDEMLYLAIPSRRDLDLGRGLALHFVETHLPECWELACGFFRRRGAYPRFKALLDQRGRLEDWYAFEQAAVEKALREWCAENDLQLRP